MRTAFSFGRLCLRHGAPRIALLPRRGRPFSRLSQPPVSRDHTRRFPGARHTLWAVLTPAAFVRLSEEDNGDGKTPEKQMLEASRAEIQKRVPDDVHGLKRALRSIYLFLDTFIYEPIATGLRFLHLVVIFVPVIFTTPVVRFGRRQKDRDNERMGTLWWYAFLVHSMERAGPAFIKVPSLRSAAI